MKNLGGTPVIIPRAMAKIRKRWADQFVCYSLGQPHDTTILFIYGCELGRWYTEQDWNK